MWPDKTVPVAEAEIDFKYDWALAATDKPNGGVGNGTAQAYYIPPSSYCTSKVSDSYVLDFDEGGYK